MKDNHNFSERYKSRKQAVLHALSRESKARESRRLSAPRVSVKVLAAVAILSALTVGVFAATGLIDFSMERDGDKAYIHAGLNDTVETTKGEDKPLRSWNIDEGGVGISLVIPDLPADMEGDKTAPGKYGSEDSTRSMTVNGVDLRRSDLDQIIGGVTDTKQFTAGDKTVYVVQKGETDYYNRIAYVVYEEDDLVLKLWVSHGINDDELAAMVSTLTIEYTTDTALAIPILNELGDGSAIDIPSAIVGVGDPVHVDDLTEMREPVRDKNDSYTVSVEDFSVYDNVGTLDPDCIIRDDLVDRFTDEKGALITYNRSQVVWLESPGKEPEKALRESVSVSKKLYVLTLDVSDVVLDDFAEEDRDIMLKAFVNGFNLNSYTVEDDEINIFYMNAVVDGNLSESAGSHEPVYREDLGDGKWRVAYLIDEDIAKKDLVLGSSTGKIYVKIQ